jgi:hypothetical protein
MHYRFAAAQRSAKSKRGKGWRVMKRRLILAALALFISGSAFADEAYWRIPPGGMLTAVAFDPFQRGVWVHPQLLAMQYVAWVEVATSDGRCSSAFKADPAAVRDVLQAGGVVPPSGDGTLSSLRAFYADCYLHNQAAFCDFAREQFGPNGKKKDEFKKNSRPMLTTSSKGANNEKSKRD